jgi:hypothetical protein
MLARTFVGFVGVGGGRGGCSGWRQAATATAIDIISENRHEALRTATSAKAFR